MDHFSRTPIQFLVIANCKNGSLSANYDRKKNFTFLKENYTISPDRKLQNRATFCKLRSQKKTGPFLKKNYRISYDHELQNWATSCKLRLQEKLNHFSTKTIEFLMIANCRNGPLSISQEKVHNFSQSWIAEMGHFLQITIIRKTVKFLKKNYTKLSWSRIAEMGRFLQITIARKLIQFLLIANYRKVPLSANHDLKKYSTISQEILYNFSRKTTISRDHELQKWTTSCKSWLQEKLCNFSGKLYSLLWSQFPEINRPYRFRQPWEIMIWYRTVMSDNWKQLRFQPQYYRCRPNLDRCLWMLFWMDRYLWTLFWISIFLFWLCILVIS